MRKLSANRVFVAACTAAGLFGAGGAGTAAAADTARARFVVAFKHGQSAAALAAIAKAGGRVVSDLSEIDAVSVELPRGALLGLRRNTAVDFVDEDVVRTIQGARTGPRVSAAATTSQTVPYGIPLVQADQLTGTPAWTPKICIVDSGIDATHEDLVGNKLSGKNYTSSGTWDSDENSHGTHVAGTIAALDNTLGVVGVAGKKQLAIHISKVFDASGSAPSSVIARAMMGCVRAKANVASMSLGGSSASRIEQRAADKMTAAGMLVIAAAGNDGTAEVSYPAGFANVMSVAAVDVNKAWATFSQFNADVEISGPGVNVLSTVPKGSQLGGSVTVGSAAYEVLGMEGSPLASVSGPLANFGLGDAPAAGSMTGKVCLIQRGTISFSDKVTNCQASGGVGAIVYNNTDGPLSGTLGDVVTTIPSVGATQADGAAMLAQVGQATTVSVFKSDAQYAEYSGTSMATPHVSAVAALVWSYYPKCTAEQIRSTLKKSALDIGDPGFDNKTGYGLVQTKAAFDRIATLGCGN